MGHWMWTNSVRLPLSQSGAIAALCHMARLLVWMSWWWIFEPVNLAVTGFLPLVVLAIFNFLPVARILPSELNASPSGLP